VVRRLVRSTTSISWETVYTPFQAKRWPSRALRGNSLLQVSAINGCPVMFCRSTVYLPPNEKLGPKVGSRLSIWYPCAAHCCEPKHRICSARVGRLALFNKSRSMEKRFSVGLTDPCLFIFYIRFW
jgi:hypothetical protein